MYNHECKKELFFRKKTLEGILHLCFCGNFLFEKSKEIQKKIHKLSTRTSNEEIFV